MAEIDAAISKLISELKKLQGEGGTGTRTDTGSTVAERSEVEEIEKRINDLYDERNNKDSEAIKKAKKERSELIKALQDERKALNEKIKKGETLQEQDKQRLESLVAQVRETDNLVQKTREAADAAKDLAGSFSNVLGGPDAVKIEDVFDPKKIVGVVTGLAKIAKAGEGMAFAKDLAAMSAEKFIGSIVRVSMQLANTEASFMKATGASKEFARSITTQYDEMREFGATMEQVSAANQELYANFTDFTALSEAQRISLGQTATALALLGVSNADFAKSIQISTKAMGMSAAQAGQNMLNLEKFAENLQVPVSQLTADFAGAGDMLAKLGDNGTKAFKDLAIVAKTTGMQMQSILNITNRFDTFEGAADQAGKLNAALGGNFVNAMDLMMATDPAERFGMIRDSILDAGLSFDEMSYYQKNFYKESLGLSDVGELAALMSDDMHLVSGATQESAQSLIDAKKRAHEMATMQENLNTALANMIPIITPLIDLMKDFTEYLAESKTAAYALLVVIGGLGLAVVALSLASKAANVITAAKLALAGPNAAALTAEAGALEAVAKAQKKVNKAKNKGGGISRSFIRSISQLGRALSAGAKGFLALGAAAVGLGTGIYLAAKGAAELALAFKEVGDNAVAAAVGIGLVILPFGLLMGALIALVAGPQAAISYAAVGLFLAIGVSAMALGAGIMFAAEGMAELVKSFAGIEVDEIYAISVAMVAFGASIVAFAYAAMMLGNPMALAGIAVLTGGIVGMAFALSLVEDLILGVAGAFVEMFSAIGNPEIGGNIKKIAEAIEAIPTKKNVEFATSMGALAAANTAAAALGTVTAVTNVVTGERTTQEKKKGDVYRVELPIIINGKQVSKEVVELIDGAATRAAAGRGVAP